MKKRLYLSLTGLLAISTLASCSIGAIGEDSSVLPETIDEVVSSDNQDAEPNVNADIYKVYEAYVENGDNYVI